MSHLLKDKDDIYMKNPIGFHPAFKLDIDTDYIHS